MRSDDGYRVEQTILQALKDLHFGSVEIIVHDSKVVLIERREKMRVDWSRRAAHHVLDERRIDLFVRRNSPPDD